jgi:transposase InsO family protein
MVESFVKTYKRDYVYVHDRPNAATVLAQLDRWFDDYNEPRPHKGLKMKFPSGIHPCPISRRVSDSVGATPVSTEAGSPTGARTAICPDAFSISRQTGMAHIESRHRRRLTVCLPEA